MSETGPLELIDFLQHMPKVEIHCHLLGQRPRRSVDFGRDVSPMETRLDPGIRSPAGAIARGASTG